MGRTSVVVDYAQAIHKRMIEEANEEGLWEGKISDLVAELGSRNRHSEIMETLVGAGAIEQYRRGAGSWPSIYKVNAEAEITQRMSPAKRATLAEFQALEGRLENIERSLGGLNVAEAIGDLGVEIEIVKRMLKEKEKEKDREEVG